jgi:TP901 family phage tail tape measure protein
MTTDANFNIMVGADLRKLNTDLSTSSLGAVDGLAKALTRVVSKVETLDKAFSNTLIGANQLKNALAVVKWDQSMTPAGMALTNKNLQAQADKGYKVLYDNLRNKYNNDLKKTREEFIRQVQPSLSSTITQGPRGGANPSRAFVEKASTLKAGSVFDDLLAKQAQYEKESLLKQDNSERNKLRATNRYTSQLIREIDKLHGQEIAAETNHQKRLQLIKKASIDAMRQMELQGKVAPSGYGVDAGTLAVGVGAIRARKLRDKEVKDQEEIAKIKSKYGEKEIAAETTRQNKKLTNAKAHSDSLARGEESAAQRAYNTAMRRYASELAQQGQFINSAEAKAKAHAEVMGRIKSRGYGVGSGIVGVNEQGNRASLIWDTAVDAAATVQARRNAKTEAEQKASNSRKERENKRHNDSLQRGDESAAQRAYNGFAKAAAAELARTGQYHNTAEVKEKIHQMAMERLRSGSYGSLGNLTRIDGAGNRSLELQNRAHAAAELAARRQNTINTPKPSVNVLARAEGQQVQNKIRMDAYGGMAAQSMRMDTMAGYAMAGATVGGGFAAVNQVVEFDKALKNVQAISSSTREQMVGLTAEIKKVGGAYAYTATEVANAGTILAQAGYGASGIKDMLNSVALLAQASGSTIEKSADTMTSIMTIFGKSGDQAGMVADQMVGAINQTKLGMDQLQLGIQYSGNLAAEMNVPMLELVSIFGAAANAGIKSGSTLGTNTRQLLQEFADPSKKFIEMLERMDLKVADVDVRVLGFTRVMKKLAEAGFTGADAMQAFEVRSGSMYTALSNQLDVLSDLPGLIDSAKDAADIASGIQMESVANSGAKAWSNFGLVLTEFSAGPMGVLKVTLDGLVAAFQFLSTTAGPTLQILGGIITAVFMATIPNALRVAIGNFFRFKTEILQASLAQEKNTVSTRAAILAYLALATAKSKATASTATTIASEIAENAARGAGVVVTNLDTAAEKANTLASNENTRSTVVNTGAQAANNVVVGLGARAKLAAAGAIVGMTAAGGGLMALMGGPIGIALMAASAAVVYFSMQTAKADENIQKLTDASTKSTEEFDKAKSVMDYTSKASDLYAQKVKALGAQHVLTDGEVIELNNSLGNTKFNLVGLGDTLGQVSARLSTFAGQSNIAANAARELDASNRAAEASARLLQASLVNTYTPGEAFLANMATMTSQMGLGGGLGPNVRVKAGQVKVALTEEQARNEGNAQIVYDAAAANARVSVDITSGSAALERQLKPELTALNADRANPRLRARLHRRLATIMANAPAAAHAANSPQRAREILAGLARATTDLRNRYPLNHPAPPAPPATSRGAGPARAARILRGAQNSRARANVSATQAGYNPQLSAATIRESFTNVLIPNAVSSAREGTAGGTPEQQEQATAAARAAGTVRMETALAKYASASTRRAEAISNKNLAEANRIQASELGDAKYINRLEGASINDRISLSKGSIDKFSNLEDFENVRVELRGMFAELLDNELMAARYRLSDNKNKLVSASDPDWIRAQEEIRKSILASSQKTFDDVETKEKTVRFKAASFAAKQRLEAAAEDYENILATMTGGIEGNLARIEEVIADKIRAEQLQLLSSLNITEADLGTVGPEERQAYLDIGRKARGKLADYLSDIVEASFNNEVTKLESDGAGTYNRVEQAAAERNGNPMIARALAYRQEMRRNDALRSKVTNYESALNVQLERLKQTRAEEDAATRTMIENKKAGGVVNPNDVVVVKASRENTSQVQQDVIRLTHLYTEAQVELAAATGEVTASLNGEQLVFQELATVTIVDAIKASGVARNYLDTLAEGLGDTVNTLSDGFQTFYENILSGNMSVIDSFSGLLQSVSSRLKSLAAEILANYTMMKIMGVLFPEDATGVRGSIGASLREAGILKTKPKGEGEGPKEGTTAGGVLGFVGGLLGLGSTEGASGTDKDPKDPKDPKGAYNKKGIGNTKGVLSALGKGIVGGDKTGNTPSTPSATGDGVQAMAQGWLSRIFSGIFNQKEGGGGILSNILNIGKGFFTKIMGGIFGGKDGGGLLGGLGKLFGGAGAGGEAGGGFWGTVMTGLKAVFAGGFADGGLIPGPNSNKDNRIAAVRSGEFVLRPEAVKSLGLDFLSNVNKSGLSALTPMINPAMGAAFTEGLASGSLLGQSRSIADQVARAPRAASGLQSLDQKIVLVDSRADRPSMGPNDVLATVSKDLQNRGALYKVIKEMR